MIVRCPTCSTQYRLDPQRLRDGRGRLRCVRCQAVFPVVSEAGPAAPAPAPAAAPARTAPAPRRIEVALVASAAGELRQLVVAALARCGARSITVDDGPTALDMARRSRPRLVVAAQALAGLTGGELIAAVRAEPMLAGTRVLLLGGPEACGRWKPSPALVHDADGHLPEDATDERTQRMVEVLLGTGAEAPAALTTEDLEACEALARVTAQDLAALAPADVAAGARSGTWPPPIADELARARAACRARIPPDRDRARAAAVFDAAVRRALGGA